MSLFSNSNSNRRIKRGGPKRQQSLLEVSAGPERPQRRVSARKFGAVAKGIFLVCLVSALAFGGRIMIRKLIWENPTYALDDIRVTTDGLLTRAQVLEIMEIQDGKNIFTVDLTKARKALDGLPQVERAEMRRVLPSRIDVRISERQPIAWVAPAADTELGVDGRAFLVDTRGYVMRTRKVLPEHLALPLITGVVMEDVAPGQKLPTAEAFSAVELIKLSAEDIRWQPRVVDVSKGYCLLVTDHRKAKVTFSFDNIEGQLARLRQIIDYVEPSQREFQSVNLMLERSVPIVFAPPPPPPAPAQEAKPAKGKASGKTTAASAVLGGSTLPPVQSVPASAFVPPKVVAVPSSAPVPDSPAAPVSRGANLLAAPSGPQATQPSASKTAAPAATRDADNPPASGVAPRSPSASSVPRAAGTAPSGEGSGVDRKTKTEQPASIKVARLTPVAPPPAPPVERPEPRVVERIKAEMKADPKSDKKKPRPAVSADSDDEPVRPKKTQTQPSTVGRAERVSEKTSVESKPEKAKSSDSAPAKTKSKNSFDGEPSSLPPDDTLRKLFNPHG